MAFDGLNIDYQGVEGHGAAQIFGPNKNIDILQDHLKTVADDLAKKRAAIAADRLNLDDKALGTAWEHDIPELAKQKDAILMAEAERQKKYNANPNLYGSAQWTDDQMRIKKMQDDLMFKVQQSAQGKTAYHEYANEYAKNPDKYRPETEAELAKILAAQGEDKWNGKRSELLNKNPFVYNEDEAKFIKDATGAIGSNVIQTDNGVTKTTTKNIVFDPKTSEPTEWGKNVALPQAQTFVDSQKGRRIIANMKRDNPELSDEDAATQLTAKILHGIDTENKKDVNLPPEKKEDTSKPKVNGDTVAYGNNVWTRRLLDDGTEMFTMTKKDAAYNKPIPFTAIDGSIVVGIPQSMTKNTNKGEDSFTINVVSEDENGKPIVKKVYYTKNNADLIKGEYGAEPFKVRKDITGTLDIGKSGVGSVSNQGIATPSPKADIKEKLTPEEFNKQWAKLPPGGSLVGPDGKTYTKKK